MNGCKGLGFFVTYNKHKNLCDHTFCVAWLCKPFVSIVFIVFFLCVLGISFYFICKNSTCK